ncbi:hypothetical protein [Streptomyces sp. NPDC054797]
MRRSAQGAGPQGREQDRARCAQRLTHAEFFAVRDEQGGQWFPRPGRQLPGHANAFAS